jgi:triosephosphate isomerase
MRKPMMAGNWKMYKNREEARAVAGEVVALVGAEEAVDVVLCAPFVDLCAVAKAVEGSKVAAGAQDVFWADEGAYTGEVSSPMLLSAGCSYVIVGHSERRGRFGTWPEDWPDELRAVFMDNDVTVNWKARAAQAHGLVPIICVGETILERRAGETDGIVRGQVLAALEGVADDKIAGLIFAYEPVWAIGTGEVCEADEANRVCGLIRSVLAEKVGGKAEGMRILYGGSMKPENVDGLMAQPQVDGGLVGGASLKAESFAKLVASAKASV